MAFFRRAAAAAAPAQTVTTGDVESFTQQIGREILAQARNQARAGMFSSRFWSDKLMDWATRDPAFKVQLFRFVDTFPMLKTSEQVHDHLVDYLSQPGVKLPPGLSLGLKAGGLMKGALAGTMSTQFEAMARTFI